MRCFLNELCKEPPLTEVEVYKLAEIHPQGREAFYKKVKREWYGKILVGTIALYIVEFTVFAMSSSWVYAAPILPVVYIAHQLKWKRNTNYGALARAKLNEPRNWPTWKRNTDTVEERKKIRRRRTVKSVEHESWSHHRTVSEALSINALEHQTMTENHNDK